jgi:hypothetical protein
MFLGKTAVRHPNVGWLELKLWTLPHWQNRQSLAIKVMDFAICGQQNLAVMRRRVAHTP